MTISFTIIQILILNSNLNFYAHLFQNHEIKLHTHYFRITIAKQGMKNESNQRHVVFKSSRFVKNVTNFYQTITLFLFFSFLFFFYDLKFRKKTKKGEQKTVTSASCCEKSYTPFRGVAASHISIYIYIYIYFFQTSQFPASQPP